MPQVSIRLAGINSDDVSSILIFLKKHYKTENVSPMTFNGGGVFILTAELEKIGNKEVIKNTKIENKNRGH